MESEAKSHPYHLPFDLFLRRLSFNSVVGLLVILVSLTLGVLGYHYLEEMSWLDAYLNAAMILSGMGPVNEVRSEAGKLFAGAYALFSGIIFLVVIAIIVAPIVHRFFHKFHVKAREP